MIHKKFLLLFCLFEIVHASNHRNFTTNVFLENFRIVAETYRYYDDNTSDYHDTYEHTRYHCYDKKTNTYLGCVNDHTASEKYRVNMAKAHESQVRAALEKSTERNICCIRWHIKPQDPFAAKEAT